MAELGFVYVLQSIQVVPRASSLYALYILPLIDSGVVAAHAFVPLGQSGELGRNQVRYISETYYTGLELNERPYIRGPASALTIAG